MMIRKLSIYNAIVIALAIFALSAPLSEARLGKGSKTEEVPTECSAPCRHGSVSSIALCHKRGGELVDICTESTEWAEHQRMGDTCGYCGTI